MTWPWWLMTSIDVLSISDDNWNIDKQRGRPTTRAWPADCVTIYCYSSDKHWPTCSSHYRLKHWLALFHPPFQIPDDLAWYYSDAYYLAWYQYLLSFLPPRNDERAIVERSQLALLSVIMTLQLLWPTCFSDDCVVPVNHCIDCSPLLIKLVLTTHWYVYRDIWCTVCYTVAAFADANLFWRTMPGYILLTFRNEHVLTSDYDDDVLFVHWYDGDDRDNR